MKTRIKSIAVMIVLMELLLMSTGCTMKEIGKSKKETLDFTVVEDADVPEQLMKIIDEKKKNTIRMTYSTKDYQYMVIGYGTLETSGYSIKVNGVYKAENSIYVDVSLIGPSADEGVTELPTTPYIVLKTEKREESVIFKM